MENKYYTPEIEEFHVGFEYESNYLKNKWTKCVLEIKNIASFFDSYILDATPLEFRVKYLNREDIEECNWKFYSEENEFDCIEYQADFKRNDWRLQCWKENQYTIERFDALGKTVWFCGTIKNKSELQKLMKMLNIE